MKSASMSGGPSRSFDDDSLLVRWLDEVKARIEAGEPIDLEDYCRRDRARAERLRRLLPAVGMMADLARASGSGTSPSFGPARPQPWTRAYWGTFAFSERSAAVVWVSSTRPSNSRSTVMSP